MGVRPSTGSAGDCYDNATAERFFATLECELIDRRSFRTRAPAKRVVFDFVEGWYNTPTLDSRDNRSKRASPNTSNSRRITARVAGPNICPNCSSTTPRRRTSPFV